MTANSDSRPTPRTSADTPESATAEDDSQRWADWLRLNASAADRDDLWPEYSTAQARADSATHLLDLVAAVEYLSRGHRAGFTVWEALEEALRWWAKEHELLHRGAPNPDDEADEEPHVDRPDPLSYSLQRFATLLADPASPPAAVALEQAIRRWTATMSNRHNDGDHWPHPSPRRAFPSTLQL